MNSKMKEMSSLNKSSKISEDINRYDRANSPDEILTDMDDEIITEMGEGELETDTRIGRIVWSDVILIYSSKWIIKINNYHMHPLQMS